MHAVWAAPSAGGKGNKELNLVPTSQLHIYASRDASKSKAVQPTISSSEAVRAKRKTSDPLPEQKVFECNLDELDSANSTFFEASLAVLFFV